MSIPVEVRDQLHETVSRLKFLEIISPAPGVQIGNDRDWAGLQLILRDVTTNLEDIERALADYCQIGGEAR